MYLGVQCSVLSSICGSSRGKTQELDIVLEEHRMAPTECRLE